MANIKITDLDAYSDPKSTDVLPAVDVTNDLTKKVSIADLMENAGSGTEALPGIAFDGDPNTGIYRPGADQLAISTAGTQRLLVSDTGAVTIPGDLTVQGTTTTIDTETLVVQDKNIELGVVDSPTDTTADGGGITLKGATDKTINWVNATDAWTSSERFDFPAGTAGAPSIILNGDVNSGIYQPAVNEVAISTDGEGRLFVESTGEVVVHANRAVNRPRIIFSAPDDGTDLRHLFGANLQVDAAGTYTTPGTSISGGGWLYQSVNSLNDHGSMIYLSAPDTNEEASTPLERLRIDAEGKLLVGTSTAIAAGATDLLQLSHDNGPEINLGRSDTTINSNNRLGGLVFWSNADDNWDDCAQIEVEADGGHSSTSKPTRIVFSTTPNGATESNTRMTIKSDGKVGIVETAPTELLTVGAANVDNSYIRVNSANNTEAGIKFYSDLSAAKGYNIGYEGDGNLFFIRSDNDGTVADRLVIDDSGNVGINETSPGALLDVNGDALINDLTIGKGAGSLDGNTAVGEDVLGNATTGGTENTGVGYRALQDLTTGTRNTAVGRLSGPNITDGEYNTFIGHATGFFTTTGGFNTGLGETALYSNVAGNNGVAIGRRSQLYANDQTTAWTNNNVSVGYEALRGSTTAANNTGAGNVAIGYQALLSNEDGSNNVAVGLFPLFNNTSGVQNTAIGRDALVQSTTGSNNVAVGFRTLAKTVGGNNSVAIGTEAQYYYNDTTTVHSNTNTAVGHQALRGSTTPANNTGLGNTAIGFLSMIDNTSGTTNTAIGSNTLSNNTTGNNNTCVGVSALANSTTGDDNVAMGINTLRDCTVLSNCTAIGHESQRYADNTTTAKDANNTSVGHRALRGSTTPADNTGTANTAVGVSAMQVNTSGDRNVGVGYHSLLSNTTGDNNTAVGHQALFRNITGVDNTAIGQDAGRYEQDGSDDADYDNCTYLGHNTRASGDNQVQLGDSATTTYAYGSVQDRSDERDKTDIRDTVIGLDFINTLRPVDFRWDMRDDYFDTEVYEEEETETVEVPNPAYTEDGDEPQYIEETRTKMVTKDRLVPVPKDGSRKRNRFHHGLIAQEVKAAADAAGVDFAGYQDHSVGGGKDVLTLGYSELIAPLIKAVQELTAENVALRARLDAAGL